MSEDGEVKKVKKTKKTKKVTIESEDGPVEITEEKTEVIICIKMLSEIINLHSFWSRTLY